MDYTLTTFTTSSTNTIGNGGTSNEYYERLLDQMDADKAYGEELKSL